MPVWVTPVLSFVGALFGAGIVLLIHWLNTRTHYQRTTFELRLKAHQEAIARCYELQRILGSPSDTNEKNRAIREVELWWEHNCLSLDTRSRRSFFSMIGAAYDHVNGWAEKQSLVWEAISETRNAITTGIGTEHLPPLRDSENLRNIFGEESN